MSKKLVWYSKNAVNNSEEFSYKDGFVYTDNLSEQLDSATVVLPFIEKKQFEPFDIVELYDDRFGYKTMLIDNLDEMQVNVDDDSMFDYTLPLMSLTKGLERITVPNFSVTRRASGTLKTLQVVIEELLEDYSPKILTENGYEQLYTIPTYNELNVACPDMQMSKPTLREAIDRVLSVIYCICKVNENHEIELFDLNQQHNEIILSNLPEINYKDETQSSMDYASELENQYNNVTPNKNLLLKNYSLITEFIGFRNEGDAVLTTQNMALSTNKPIYSIKSFRVYWRIEGGGGDATQKIYESVDLTSSIYEESAFNVLDFDTQNVSVYYSRGSNKISGFSTEKGWWIFNKTTLERIVESIHGDRYSIMTPLRDAMFKIEYYAQDETVRGKSGKYLPETNENNAIIDNPSEAFVDIQRQGELFNQKVNRLGNRAKVMTGRFTDYSRIPVLGDYYGNYIVMNRELQFYDYFINVKLTLTENFVNINYFTGINARRRSWQIVSAGEAFDKQLLDKWYCEFSFNIKSDYDNASTGISASYLLQCFSYTSKPILHSIIETPYTTKRISDFSIGGISDAVDPFNGNENVNFLELDLTSYISGNSLIFNFQFMDNYSSIPSLMDSVTGGLAQRYNKYVDSNGENLQYHYFLLHDLDLGNVTGISDSDWENGTVDATTFKKVQVYSAIKPRVAIDDVSNLDKLYEMTIYNHKDNREKININVQFEFCSDTKDIVIGRKFLERQNAVSTLSASNADINVQLPVTARYTQQLFEPTSTVHTGTLQVTGTGNPIGTASDTYSGSAIHTSTVNRSWTESFTRSQTASGYAATHSGNYYYTQYMQKTFSEIGDYGAILSYDGPFSDVSVSGNIVSFRLRSTSQDFVSGTITASWSINNSATFYKLEIEVPVGRQVTGIPTIVDNDIQETYPQVTDLHNSVSYSGTSLFITAYGELSIVSYSGTYEYVTSYSYLYEVSIGSSPGPQLDSYSITRGSINYNQFRGVFYGTISSPTENINETITYSYTETSQTPIGWKGYGTVEVPELRYVENVRNVTITPSTVGNFTNTVTYSNGIFSYEVYTTETNPLLPYIGVISFTYNFGSYRVYSCNKKYKYGDQKLKTGSQLCDSYTINTTATTQRTATLDITTSRDLGNNQQSIAICDADENLILAINTTNANVTCYLNLLRTRDRKVYTDKTLKHFNS